MLANLIGEVVAVAPEEEEDQVEVPRSIGYALLQDMREVGNKSLTNYTLSRSNSRF